MSDENHVDDGGPADGRDGGVSGDSDRPAHRGVAAATRRRVLRSAGVASALGVAGLPGTAIGRRESVGGPPETTDAADATAQVADSDFTVALGITNPNINFNEFNFTNYSWDLGEMLYDPFAQWDPANDEWIPFLLSGWQVGDGTLTLEVRDGWTWHTTGEPVTAEDVAASLQLEIWMNFSVSEYATEARATGDRTVELPLRDTFNRNVVEHELLGGTWVSKPPHVYEEWITRFEEASGEEEMNAVREELGNWTLSEPFGYGPFAVSRMNEQRIVMEPHDGHPESDAINFDTYTVEFISSNQKFWQALRTDRLDGIPKVFAPKPVLESFPDHVVQVRLQDYGGFGVTFDHEHPDFGKRPVRQAIACAIDREQVATNSGPTMRPVQIPTGLPSQVNDEWLGEEASAFDPYAYDTQRAASLMREAGYERQGDTWTGPNGPVSASLHAPAGWSDWVTAGQTIAGQLQQFGLDVSLSTTEVGTFQSQIYDKGQFAITCDGFGGGPYPLFAFQAKLNEQNREPYNYPAEVTVPAPSFGGGGGAGTGNESGGGTDSDELTLDLPSLFDRLDASAKNDRQAFLDLAWAWNRDLPMLPIHQADTQSFVTTDDWAVPPADDPAMHRGRPAVWLPKVGKLQAKTGD